MTVCSRFRQLCQCCSELFRFESKWSRLALVGYAAVLVNQIDPIGPTGVSLLSRVAKFIEHGRKFDSQLTNAGAGNQGTLFFSFRTGEDNFVFDVAFHLPHVAGMGLGDVDNKKRDLPLILIVELVEGGNLPPEWWSSVTAEDHDHRLRLSHFGEMDGTGLVELGESEIGCHIANMNRPRTRMRPHGFEGTN